MRNGTKQSVILGVACVAVLAAAGGASGAAGANGRDGLPSLSDSPTLGQAQYVWSGKGVDGVILFDSHPALPDGLYSHVDIPEIAGKGGSSGSEDDRGGGDDPSGEATFPRGGKVDLFGPGVGVDLFGGAVDVSDGLRDPIAPLGGFGYGDGSGRPVFDLTSSVGIPTPGGIGVLSLGVLAMARRRRR